jgi:hypothetical protein
MKSFEVKINGKKQCTAGVGQNGVLTAILSFAKRTRASHETDQASESEILDIRVAGSANIDPGTSEHLEWLHRDLSVGDEITIKIVEVLECDEPKTKETSYLQCSFCGREQAEAQNLIAGPGVYICDECVNDALQALIEGEPTGNITILVAKEAEARCSFCGQKPVEVVRIVGVPSARICNQCLKICAEILEGTPDS